MLKSLLALSVNRLWNRRLLSALLTLSTAATVAMLVCIPAFSGAVGRRLIQEEFGYAGEGYARPPFTALFYARSSSRQPLSWTDLLERRTWLEQMLRNDARLRPAESYLLTTSPRQYLMASKEDSRYTDPELASVSLMTGRGLDEQVEVIRGDAWGTDSTDALNLWVARAMADDLALRVGERYTYGEPYGADESRIPVRIAGIWEPVDPQANLWDADPVWHFDHRLLVLPADFERFVSPRYPSLTNYTFWYFVLDQGRVNLDRSATYAVKLERIGREVEARLPGGTMEQGLVDRLARGHARKQALSWSLLGIALPLLAIILCFVGAVSGMLNRMQAQEVAMLISRGSSRVQVLLFGLIDSLVISLVALPPGIFLGLAAARLMGYSAGFMRLVPRNALPVTLASVNWVLVGTGLVVTILARLILSWLASRRSIVAQEQENARASVGGAAVRWVTMLLLGLTGAYAYYRLIQVGSLSVLTEPTSAASAGAGAEGSLAGVLAAAADPLLILAPSLFLLLAPMLLTEFFVISIRPLAWLSTLARKVGFYVALNDLGREGRQYRIAIYMLTLCLAFGVYSASLARSADRWLLDRRQYEVGADLVLVPETVDEMAARLGISVGDARAMDMDTGVVPASEYARLPGVAAAAQVGQYEAAARVGRILEPVTLLAVDRLGLPAVTYFRDDYAGESVGALMNRLGATTDGVLMSRGFAQAHQLELGQRLNVTVVVDPAAQTPVKAVVELEIVGLYDYFPTMTQPEKQPVLVVDLGFMQVQSAGMLPYGVWLRLEPGADSQAVQDSIPGPMRAPEEKTKDLQALLEQDFSRLERVGILGLLSVSFITGALLSALGLLVHSATAQRRRSLRFAVLQVLGMERGVLVSAMLIEYTLTLLYSIVGGTALGVLASYLYVPLVHLGGEGGIPIPPYRPIIDQSMAVTLAATLLAALILAEAAMLAVMLRAKVFEVLRLGTRE